jgi:hypothetical protein
MVSNIGIFDVMGIIFYKTICVALCLNHYKSCHDNTVKGFFVLYNMRKIYCDLSS